MVRVVPRSTPRLHRRGASIGTVTGVVLRFTIFMNSPYVDPGFPVVSLCGLCVPNKHRCSLAPDHRMVSTEEQWKSASAGDSEAILGYSASVGFYREQAAIQTVSGIARGRRSRNVQDVETLAA